MKRAEGIGGLVAADLTALCRHVLVQAAPHRILQRRDRVDVFHPAILGTTRIGDRREREPAEPVGRGSVAERAAAS